MGWMRTLLLGDIGNRLDIEDAETRIRDMSRRQSRLRSEKTRKDRDQDQRIDALQGEVAELELTVAVLTSQLLSRGVLDPAELDRALNAAEGEAPPTP